MQTYCVYILASKPYTLDVAQGVPVGFSLVAEDGVVFKVERVVG